MTDTDAGTDTETRDALAAAMTEMTAALNTEYEDSVVFVARVLGGHPGATAARVVSIDTTGFDCVVTAPGGVHHQRLGFANELTEPNDISTEMFALLTRARERSGEDGLTSVERLMAQMNEIRTFLAQVTKVEQVHPHLRRITFSGDDLSHYTPLAPDAFVYVLLPPPGRTELTIDRSFSWEEVGAMPEDERPVGANYTVRAWHPERSALDVLFVLHGDTGPASAWAERARPGDPVALWGPRSTYHPPAGTDWYLLVADETGLPAVASILESLPAGTVARVLAEVADESEHQELPSAPSFEVTWLHRGGRPPGTTSLLADAVRGLSWPEGTPYVWGGGESRTMTAIRNHVRHDRGLPREAVSLTAYWRLTDPADPIDPADPVDPTDAGTNGTNGENG